MPHRIFNNSVLKLRAGEATTAWLMFAYSFLAMTSYNIVKPLTKGKFIDYFGAENMPYFTAAAAVVIGLLMYAYSRTSSRLPGRAVVPVTLTGLGGLLITFWFLFKTDATWVSAAFNVFGLMFGILTISQFWTIANDIYDSRQARRLFGFIGGGASLGGAVGSGLTGFFQSWINENNLLLVSAMVLGVCIAVVTTILRRQPVTANLAAAGEERGVGSGEALRLLRESRHLQIIALVILFAQLGAVIMEQQLYMVAKAASANSVSAFLGKVTFYVSITSFIVQVGLTSVIHRSLGLAVALLILPFGLGSTAFVILTTGVLWAPAVGRVLDSALRYSLDKTTREVLFLPLPSDLKLRAKPFVDVTVDRLGKGLGGLMLIVLIQPWGLHLSWQQLSYASLVVMSLWVALALVARREYLRSFRKSLGAREIEPGAVRATVADAATIETLVEELAHPDEASVLYAIDMLEMLDRRHLITPLLIHHESPKVRTRALLALMSVRSDLAQRWTPAVHRMLKDPDADVRSAAVRALEALAGTDAPELMHRILEDADPRVAATAATVLADSPNPADRPVALAALTALIGDDRALASPGRREAAAALAHISHPDFRALLLPLLHDRDVNVAREAITSARAVGGDPRFVPALVSLLGHRVLKAPARAALVSFGEGVIQALAYFLTDQGEHVWVRRHVPATLAAIPCQASMNALFDALDDADGFLRYKIIEAIETLRRNHPELTMPVGVVEALLLAETTRYYNYLTLRANIVRHDAGNETALVVRALGDKLDRTTDRVFRLLGLIYAWKDIAAARQALQGRDLRTRAQAVEYLDNLLAGPIRRRVMPMLEDHPLDEKVSAANAILRTRPRDLEDTIAQLVHEPDPVVAAAAIAFVQTRRLWSLADDLEYVAERRSGDHLVADAATWALAAHRRSLEGPGTTTNTPLPIVELADRLRAIPLFDFVSVDELFRIAAAGRQMRHAAGHTVYEFGAVAEDVQFLTEGAVRLSGGNQVLEVRAPAALAFEDMLEGRPVGHAITATEPSVSLCLSSGSLLTMMSDNIVLARGFFRMLLANDPDRLPSEAVQASAGHRVTAWRLPLEPVEKAGLLRLTPILSRASVDQLLDLVAISRDVPLVEGTSLFTGADLPAVYYVLDGEVVLEQPGAEPIVVKAGCLIGMAETLAGFPLRCSGRVVRSGHALRIDQDPLFDVLADHVDLLQGLFSGVMKATRRPASR